MTKGSSDLTHDFSTTGYQLLRDHAFRALLGQQFTGVGARLADVSFAKGIEETWVGDFTGWGFVPTLRTDLLLTPDSKSASGRGKRDVGLWATAYPFVWSEFSGGLPLITWQSLDPRLLPSIDETETPGGGDGAAAFSCMDGLPARGGEPGVMVYGTDENRQQGLFAPMRQLVASHRSSGQFSQPVFDMLSQSVDWDRQAGLHGHLRVVSITPGKKGQSNVPGSQEPEPQYVLAWFGDRHGYDGSGGLLMRVDAINAWMAYTEGGPFHPRFEDSPGGFKNTDGEKVQFGGIWTGGHFVKTKEWDGPLRFDGPNLPPEVRYSQVSWCYRDWDDGAKRWQDWTTVPYSPASPPWRRPTDKVPRDTPPTTVPGERVPQPAGTPGTPFTPPTDKVSDGGNATPPEGDGSDAAPGKGKALRPKRGVPMRPLKFDYEAAVKSLALQPVRDRATQPYDGRYGGSPLDGLTSDGRQIVERLPNGVAEGGPLEGLTSDGRQIGEQLPPPPYAVHVEGLASVDSQSGRWEYASEPGVLFDDGTAAAGCMYVSPGGYLSDGPDDQSDWLGAVTLGLHPDAVFGWGAWSASAAALQDGPRFSITGSSGSRNLVVDFLDDSGASRADGAIVPTTAGQSLGSADLGWKTYMRFAHVRGGSGATITVEHEHTVNAQAGVVRLPDAPGDGYPIQIHNRDPSSNTSVRASAYTGYGGSDYINVNSAGGEEFTIAPNDGVTLFYDATDGIWYAAGEYDHT